MRLGTCVSAPFSAGAVSPVPFSPAPRRVQGPTTGPKAFMSSPSPARRSSRLPPPRLAPPPPSRGAILPLRIMPAPSSMIPRGNARSPTTGGGEGTKRGRRSPWRRRMGPWIASTTVPPFLPATATAYCRLSQVTPPPCPVSTRQVTELRGAHLSLAAAGDNAPMHELANPSRAAAPRRQGTGSASSAAGPAPAGATDLWTGYQWGAHTASVQSVPPPLIGPLVAPAPRLGPKPRLADEPLSNLAHKGPREGRPIRQLSGPWPRARVEPRAPRDAA